MGRKLGQAGRALATGLGLCLGAPALAQTPAPPPPTDAVLAAPLLASAPAAEIGNGLIRARVLLPDPARGYYRGTRFDWSGIVSSLTYRGQEFYGPWYSKLSPSTRDYVYDGEDVIVGLNSAAMGPAEEFDNAHPPGFDEAAPGGTFVKIGVGALRRADANPYSSTGRYAVVDPGRWSARARADAVEFRHDLQPNAGYGYSYTKVLRLVAGQPRMVIEHSLRNTGTKPIVTTVYNHNFLTFGGAGMGPDLSISGPFQVTSSRPSEPPFARIQDGRLVYVKRLEDRERVFMPIEGFGPGADDHRLRVESGPLRAAFEVVGDRPLTRIQLWSIRTVMSVEPFITLNIAPGEEARWSHTYTYSAGGA